MLVLRVFGILFMLVFLIMELVMAVALSTPAR